MTNKMNCWICDSKKISKINIVCNKKLNNYFVMNAALFLKILQ